MSRAASVRPRTAALLLASACACISLTHAGHPGVIPVNRWLSPASGDWDDPVNWTLGTFPGQGPSFSNALQNVVVDAQGAAYTVTLDRLIGQNISTFVLDSVDATVLLDRSSIGPQTTSTLGFERYNINAGIMQFEGFFAGLSFERGAEPNLIGSLGQIRVGDVRQTSARLFGRLTNDGVIAIGENSSLSVIDTGGDISLTNGSGGEIVLGRRSSLRFETLINHGAIRTTGHDASFRADSGPDLPYFENHGAVLADGDLDIFANGLHSGEFRVADQRIITFSGQHFFTESAALNGEGDIRFGLGGLPLGTVRGNARVLLEGVSDIAAHFAGDLRVQIDNSDHVEFQTRFDGGTLDIDDTVSSITFNAPIDASFAVFARSDRFETRRGLATDGLFSIRTQNALLEGLIDVGSLELIRAFSSVMPDSEFRIRGEVRVRGDASITGIEGYGAIFEQQAVVDGDLFATAVQFQNRVTVGGDATFNGNNTVLPRGIQAGGRFSFNGGAIFDSVVADEVLFTRSLGVDLYSESITANTVTVQGAELRLRATLVSMAGDLVIEPAQTPFANFASRLETTIRYADSLDQILGRAIAVIGDVSLTGDLEVLLFSNSDPFESGASFTLIESGGDVTGQFDRLFLPSLPGGLFFDVVYEPSAVRLVVVPSPGATALAGLGALTLTRRHRRARATALASAALASVAGLASTSHAGPTTTRWAAPVSGNFYDAANWDDAIGPALGADMVIDASGQAYTVDWSRANQDPAGPRVNSLLLDSDDARLLLQGDFWFGNRDFRVSGDTVIRRGTFEITGQLFSSGALRIESGGRLDVVEGPSASGGFRGAQLALDVFNDGDFIVRGGATLTQIRTGESLPTGIRIVNHQSGTMRFEGGNAFTAGILENNGLIVLENDPQFNGGTPPFGANGVVFGPIVSFQPTTFHNHGAVRVEQGGFGMGSSGIHSGQFELVDPDSVLSIGGDNWFLPGSRITGPGTTFLSHSGSVGGVLSIEGDLELDTVGSNIGASLDVGGTVRLRSGADGEFAGALRANLIEDSFNRNFRFLSVADIAFNDTLGSAEFFAPAIIRSDLVSRQDRSVFHLFAHVTGSVENAAFMREAIIGGNASNVVFNLGASIAGDLTGGATAFGRVNVQGDVIATTGDWSFDFVPGASIDAVLDVTGDITITRPFTIRGDIVSQGDFSAFQGRFADITADTVRFGTPTSSTFGNITILSNSRIETGGGRAIIDRTRIASDSGGPANGFETVVFANGFEVIYNPVTQFTRSGFSVVVNADAMRETTFHFYEDSILAGTLDVAIIGDASNLSYGDTFTVLDGRLLGGADPVATLTGQFDRLFLPSLPGGLFFDIVYEPSAVRLVVVPSPGATALLAIGALVGARRFRRNTALA